MGQTLAKRLTLGSKPPYLRHQFTDWRTLIAPAAGANFPYLVSGSYWERIVGLTFQYVTSASGAARVPFLAYQNGDGFAFLQIPIAGVITTSKTIQCYADIFGRPYTTGLASQSAYGTATTPAAGTSLASISPVEPDDYTVEWTVELSGTVAAGTDNDNFGLFQGATLLAQSVNPAVVGQYPQQPVDVNVSSAGSLVVKNINAGTAGAVYAASETIIPASSSNTYAQLPDVIMPSGHTLLIGVTNIQAGDQISQVGVITERYSSNYAEGQTEADREEWLRSLIRSEVSSSWNG